jgi:hypothetical protein
VRPRLFLLAVTIALLAIPREALACPVCFGQSDAPLALAINRGVLAMLGFVAVVLSAFAAFMIYLYRRAKLVDETVPAPGVHAR